MPSVHLVTGTNLEDWAAKAIREGLDETGYVEGRKKLRSSAGVSPKASCLYGNWTTE
jgi:hypothetical protein